MEAIFCRMQLLIVVGVEAQLTFHMHQLKRSPGWKINYSCGWIVKPVNSTSKNVQEQGGRHHWTSLLIIPNDFAIEDSCCIGFDLWEDIAAQPRPDTIKVKDCPIYEQLCAIFTDSSPDGKYAQSSHFEGFDKSFGHNNVILNSVPEAETQHPENPSSSRLIQGNALSPEKVTKNVAERKRKQQSETRTSLGQSRRDQEILKAMAGAMLEMVAASKLRTGMTTQIDERFSITNCIKALDEMEAIDEQLYFAALDLFDDPNLRETFISLKGDKIRLTWLQGKRGKNITTCSLS
ncbi:hypothetical protein Patl1_09558 [Pistacia atlantica]|uniref:Uncharacterized protein n=1 Tax=Pistacia atlantica TaxID=434234 RepID=A0ACC1AIT5_9ROSI|nr:hypothetical protein Patl1_09558 [Pistacia atlantica]